MDLSKYFSDPEGSISAYLGRVKRGYPHVIRSTFYKDKDPSTVLSNWRKILNTIAKDWPTLCSFEEDLAKKVGPLSVMQPLDKRLPDIDSYYDSINIGGSPVQGSAIDACIEEFKSRGFGRPLKLRSIDATVANMRLSTNSGSPYFTNRRDVLPQTIPCSSWISTSEVVSRLVDHDSFVAAVIGWRGQEGGPTEDDVKQRVVWMFPLSVNINELQAYQPMIERMQAHDIVPAWNGLEAVDAAVTRLFDSKPKEDLIICTDFSKFDQHFNSFLQDAALEVTSSLLAKGKSEMNWLKEVFPIKYMIPLVLQPDLIRYGEHGMGSGSGGTNFDETMAHRCLQHEAALSRGESLNVNSMCLGDDGILTYPGINVKDVLNVYTRHGLEMNETKQYASKDDCVYLRRWHHTGYRENGVAVGVYSTFRALGKLMYQERFYSGWSEKAVALRQLSIIENCNHHPLREKFAQFCMHGDRFRLGIDIPEFLDNIEGEARSLKDELPDFMSYTQSLGNNNVEHSINNWWIVRYLKSHR